MLRCKSFEEKVVLLELRERLAFMIKELFPLQLCVCLFMGTPLPRISQLKAKVRNEKYLLLDHISNVKNDKIN